MIKLELSDAERLILANQYDIMARLDRLAGEPGSDVEALAEWLRKGYVALYEDRLDGELWPALSESKADLVLEILNMYTRLQQSFDLLVAADVEASGIEADSLRFPGFDGNNDAQLLSFADAMMRDRRYEYLANAAGRCPSGAVPLDAYLRMLDVLKSLPNIRYELTAAEVALVLAARIHPSCR